MAVLTMAHAQTSEERNSMPTQSTTLLIVDDDGVLLHLLSVIMAHSGFDVRTAQDGFAALAAIRAEIPDILLSDLYMPGMSGFELLSVVRRRFPAIPVIAMSSTYSGPGVPARGCGRCVLRKGDRSECAAGNRQRNSGTSRWNFRGHPKLHGTRVVALADR